MRVVINYQEYADVEVEKGIIRAAFPDTQIVESRTVDEETFLREARGVDVALLQYVPVSARALEALPACRGLIRYGIGYNNIDLAQATARGKWVANVPHYCLDEVSNHALAMILALNRKLLQTDRLVRNQTYHLSAVQPIPRLKGATVGIVGLGHIGRLLADKCQALGVRVLIHDPLVGEHAGCTWADLARLCAEADYVSLHLPLLPQTRNLFSRERLETMKPGACIINTGRGGTLDESALAELLKSGRLGGAGLDVYAVEPLPADSPLRTLDNVILTSHNAWYSEGAISELKATAAAQVVQVLRGERPTHALNTLAPAPAKP